MWTWIGIVLALLLVGGFLYWLLITTEGVFLGRRVVVWLYNVTAHRYDQIKEFEPEWEEFFIARPLLHRLRHVRAPRVLDVATGTGRVPLALLEAPTFNGRVIGVEPAPRMLTGAADKLRPFHHRAAFVQGTAVPLPFPDASFDAVTCLEALEFLPSDSDAMREMVRVLRPGGVLMVTRRRGLEAKAFLHRYRNVARFEQWLYGYGFARVDTQPWQFTYDIVLAEKET